MFIEPNTNIRILKNVPLDSEYKNTINFTSATAQRDYFIGLTKHNLSNHTYQRVQKGVARVGINAEALYDCNYMMFQNASFGAKWFYAFITGVEYVNNVVSEITFEIDDMQTWHFDYSLKECFVEREHSVTDNIGDNLVPEKLEHGEYIADDFDGTGHFRNYKIVVAATVDAEGNDATGGTYGGIYSGLRLNVFDNYTSANQWISNIESNSKGDSIVSVFMIPNSFVTNVGEAPKSYEISKTKQITSIDGYVPRNKKLFCYPYNFLYVSNLDGNSATFNYEYFSDDDCKFTLAGDFSCNPNVILFPMNYKGVPANIDEKMTIGGFPQCSWNTDAFKAWLAQGGAISAVSTAGSIGMALAMANPVTTPVAIASTVGMSLIQTAVHAVMPPQAHGLGGNSSQVALGVKDFAFMHKHIRKEFAKIIDEYFDVYGYATHRVKIPNTNSRPYWNYVQTIDCTIVGSLPADAKKKICSIYNKGITFWKNGANIGNYSLDNRPSSSPSATSLEIEEKGIEDETTVASV